MAKKERSFYSILSKIRKNDKAAHQIILHIIDQIRADNVEKLVGAIQRGNSKFPYGEYRKARDVVSFYEGNKHLFTNAPEEISDAIKPVYKRYKRLLQEFDNTAIFSRVYSFKYAIKDIKEKIGKVESLLERALS